MQNNGANLVFLLQALSGLLSVFLPLIFAIKSKDAFAIMGVIILLFFGLITMGSANSRSYVDQILVIIVWFASLVLAVAAHYAPRKAKPEDR